MLTAAELSGLNFSQLPSLANRVLIRGRASADDSLPSQVRTRSIPRVKSLELVMRVMADGRYRTSVQIAAEARISRNAAQKYLCRKAQCGDVTVQIVAGQWLYGLTSQGG